MLWETADVQSPPSGTVTFLFTDIEGSTRLWEERPEEMRSALADHDRVVRDAIESNGGSIFATGGDGFAAAFHRAADALAAAHAVQAGLEAIPFLRVRAGIHTGEVEERGGDYFGPAVNRAARIMAAGHGGQVLISATSAGIVGTTHLIDLGEHTFPGLATPERVFQGGPSAFPPLRSLGPVASNLPAERSEFIGRDLELATVAGLIRSARLVTLTGVGGVGKTRLAVQVSAGVIDEFPGGVWLAELAPLIDGALVAATVSAAVGAPTSPDIDSVEALCRHLVPKRALVVLDNCEHLIESVATFVDRLLSFAPRTKILATSREPLGVPGESVWRVPSLSVDGRGDTDGDAVALFLTRARLARQDFVADPSKSEVMRVCRRLDGIPLAIELAAARIKVLSIEQIASRLDERFRLLTRGSRTAVARQQTLQNTIDWSYELLTDAERDFFDLLGVFAGDFDLAAAAQVAGSDEFEALDLIEQLTDKSMLEADPTRERYRLLETLRQYAWDRLAATNRLTQARDAHASYYARLVADLLQVLHTPGRQVDALDLLDADYDNLRATLAYLIDAKRADDASRMVRRLVGVFNLRHPREGLGWFQAVIDIAAELPPKARARLLGEAAHAAMNAGDSQAQARYAQAAIDTGGADAPAIAHIQLAMWHSWNNDPANTVAEARRALDKISQDPAMQIFAGGLLIAGLGALGLEAETIDDIPWLIKTAAALADPTFAVVAYLNAGVALALLGHDEEAIAMLEHGLVHADAGGPQTASGCRVWIALLTNDIDHAAAQLRIGIPIAQTHLTRFDQLNTIVGAARVAYEHERHNAARLLGAYKAHIDQVDMQGNLLTRRHHDLLMARLAQDTDAATLDRELQRGRDLTLEQALHLALDVVTATN